LAGHVAQKFVWHDRWYVNWHADRPAKHRLCERWYKNT